MTENGAGARPRRHGVPLRPSGRDRGHGFESRYAEPNGMVIMEIWKVDAGEIVHVESILDVFEYGRPLGWS